MQEKDFKIFWNTIADYAHENKISVDINALPFYEDMAKKLSKKYGIDVYKFNDEYIGDQGVYCILILDRIFEGDLKENVNEWFKAYWKRPCACVWNWHGVTGGLRIRLTQGARSKKPVQGMVSEKI